MITHRAQSRREFLRATGRAGAATVLAVGWPSIRTSRASAKLPDKIVMGYLPVNAVLPMFAGPVNFWKDEGLNVEFSRFAGGPAILQALASGSIPVGDVGNGPAIVTASRGLPFIFPTFGGLSSKRFPYTRIMVRGDSPIKRIEELRGKTLALHQRGTMEDVSLGAAARVFQIQKEEFKITLIPYPNQAQVLQQKQVDAIYAAPPGDAVAERQFGARTLVETVDFIPFLGYTTLAVRRDFASEYPDAVTRLCKGWIRFCRWIDDNRELARKTSNENISIPAGIDPHVRLLHFARNGLPALPNLWHIYYLLLDAKIINPMASPEKLLDQYFVEPAKRFTLPALEELGWQKDPVLNELVTLQLPMLPKPVHEYHAPWEKQMLKG